MEVSFIKTHQLWINMSESTIFSIYPHVLEHLFNGDQRVLGLEETPKSEQSLLLPSNIEWKTKMYYQLVEKHRKMAKEPESMPVVQIAKTNWDDMPQKVKRQRPSSKASKRLSKPPKRISTENSQSEEEKSDGNKGLSSSSMESITTLNTYSLNDSPLGSPRGQPPVNSSNTISSSLALGLASLESSGFAAASKGNWPVSDIAKAAHLLATPPSETTFIDEQEMRRVYSLIYDVFRYKNVLNETLCNVNFFTHNPETVQEVTRVWLLLFDLYHRRFSKHDHTEDEVRESLYAQAGILGIDELLWKHRVRLAAEISRIRIKNNALNLSELLPPHLRDEKVAAAINNTECVTGWINTFRSKRKSDIADSLLKLGMVESKDVTELKTNQYSFDNLCPKFMICRPEIRQAVAQSWLVKKHHLILQDRSFCLGPVMFCRVLEENELTGYVLQTHVNSPRTTAYLANILSENDKIFQLIAFGAGPRKKEYDRYFANLGITNTTIFAEKLVDISPESDILEHVVAVYATPPNSYSGVVDPIDLVCSRGGDLSILEVLTESEINDGGKQRVAEILNDQKRTLRFSMSRPQIQFVLYETHSILKAENIEMVKRILEEMNTASKEKHAERQGVWNDTVIPIDKLLSDTESIPDDSSADGKKELSASKSQREFENLLATIEVPPCDVFQLTNLPALSSNESSKDIFKNYGCFLALLQRKELTRLDHKYMIKMAEARGLFGDDQAAKKQTSSRQKKREERKTQAENDSKKSKKTKKPTKINAERIAAPTHCTQMRHLLSNSAVTFEALSALWSTHACKRFRHHQHHMNETSRGLKWWRKTVKHILSMRLVLSWTNNNLNVSPDQILEAGKGLKPLKLYRRFKKANKPVFKIPLNVVKYNGPCANYDQIIIDGIKMGCSFLDRYHPTHKCASFCKEEDRTYFTSKQLSEQETENLIYRLTKPVLNSGTTIKEEEPDDLETLIAKIDEINAAFHERPKKKKKERKGKAGPSLLTRYIATHKCPIVKSYDDDWLNKQLTDMEAEELINRLTKPAIMDAVLPKKICIITNTIEELTTIKLKRKLRCIQYQEIPPNYWSETRSFQLLQKCPPTTPIEYT